MGTMGSRRPLELGLLATTTAGVVFLCMATVLGWFTPVAGGQAPEVLYATGTAHCSAGTYDGVTTGNQHGTCKDTETGPEGETRGYQCDDGKGNSATINCQANGGLGTCTSTGAASCGKFQPHK